MSNKKQERPEGAFTPEEAKRLEGFDLDWYTSPAQPLPETPSVLGEQDISRYYGWTRNSPRCPRSALPLGGCQYLVERNGILLWNAYYLNMGKKHHLAGNLLLPSIGQSDHCRTHSRAEGTKVIMAERVAP